MKEDIKRLRDGIFSELTRRFGTVAEEIIRKRYGLAKETSSQHHDATGDDGERIEIKFSRALKSSGERITQNNLIEQVKNASMSSRAIYYKDIHKFKFDCNIQQVKRAEFDVLYYGVFFADKIAVFAVNSEDVLSIKGYSDFQHKGNAGEGQFHINPDTLDYHFNNNFLEWITYEEVMRMFKK